MKPFDYSVYLKSNPLLREIKETSTKEGSEYWDFKVFDMDPELRKKLIEKVKKLGINIKIKDIDARRFEMVIHPYNEKNYKTVHKILGRIGASYIYH